MRDNPTFNKTDPVTGNSTWTARMQYDVMGKVVESEDANGTKINYSYDAADRVLSATYSDGTPSVSYKYDLIPNGKGALIETSNGVSTSKTTQIDQWGRPTEYQQITDGQTYTSKYSYNLSGALIEEEYPSGKKVKNDFDANGDVERVWGTNGASNQMYANAFNYTASGGIASMRLGNGQWETAKFNNRLQVEELGLGHSATNAGTWKVNYEFGEYDPNSQTVTGSKNTGNIARQTVSFDGLPNAFVQTYQYDSLYRLTDANEMAGSSENWSEKFTYDRYGNRDKKFRNGLEIANNALSHPSIDPNTNRFTTTGYGYDKVGNLVTDAEGRNFTFDGNNKQRIVYDGNQTVGEYFYDGDGMRVKKKVYSNGTHTKTVVFVYSSGKLVEEYSTEAPPTDKKIKYLTKDHLGTPRIITDGNGAVVSRRDFMPFGEEIANNVGTRSISSFKYSANEDDVRQKFTGYQQDSETQLDFAEARMYENRHARFTAVDPLLASGKSSNPQTFNRYVYVMNSPLMLIDPTGLIGDYYDRQGNWLFNDNIDDEKVWIVKSTTVSEDGTTNHDGIVEIEGITHKEFQTISNIVKYEAGDSNVAEEFLWIAHTTNNEANFQKSKNNSRSTMYKLLMSGFSKAEEGKSPLSDKDKSFRSNSARAGVIDVLLGGKDPTGGARRWDGTDFLAWGLDSPDGGPHNKFNEFGSILIRREVYARYVRNQEAKTIGYYGKRYNIPADVFKYSEHPQNWGEWNMIKNGKQIRRENGFKYTTEKKGVLYATGTKGKSIFWGITTWNDE